MTRLLASVIGPEEAAIALDGGADIIDLKDPSAGALGALPIAAIRQVCGHLCGRRPVSATIGDLPPDPVRLVQAVEATAAAGVDYVKIGFFGADNLPACLDAIAPLAARQGIVAVLFADRASSLDDLAPFAEAGFAGAMLDTADKARGSLLEHASLAELGLFIARARGCGLLAGLAGSLRLQDIPLLLPLAPDYLGFRGALCCGSRRARRIDEERVRAIRRLIGSTIWQVA